MHIAIVLSALGAGGAERVAAMLSEQWTAKGHRVTVISFDSPEDPVFHAFPPAVTLARLGTPGTRLGTIGRLAGLRRFIADARPDVAVSFLTKNNLLTLLATLGTGTRTICCERNNPERQDAHPLWNALLNHCYPLADAIVCQTQAVTRCIPTRARSKVHVIPNPVNSDWTAAAPSARGQTIVSVGRLTRQKGFDVLIRAFASLAQQFPGWELVIWGEGQERIALESLVENLGLAGKVRLPGTSDRPGGWMAAADIFVLPSRYEGFPNVLAEAMAAGIPSVSTDCDFGPADMVEHGVSGSLVRVEDEPALAAALSSLMSAPELRERYSRNARLAMRRYEAGRVLAQWDELIEAVRTGEARPAAGIAPKVEASVAR